MRTGKDFQQEFPAMDAGFAAAVQQALAVLSEPERKGRFLMRGAALLTALLVLLATAAVAAGVARRNAADFINANQFANMNQAAAEVLAASTIDLPMDTPWAHMTLRQAVYDGMAVYLLFEAAPVSEGWMIAAGAEYQGHDQAFSHGSSYPTDVGIREYAAQQGYAGLQLLEIFADETTGSLFDSAMNEDGTCSLMVWAFVKPEYREQPELTLNLRIRDASANRIYQAEEPRYPVTLPLAGEVRTSASGQAIAIPEAGVAVTGVTVHRTVMTSYILVAYDVTDQARYRSLFYSGRMNIAGADGSVLPKGTHPLSLVVDRPVQGMGEGTYYITNRQLPEDADAILLTIDGRSYTFTLQ